MLGGLDEGVWPPRVETDAFLNRPMRARLGLSSPEQRIGQTAHDFVQLLGASDVVITRARKRGGSPMVPSRFLQRLQAFAGKKAWACITERGDVYLALAQALETPRRRSRSPGPRRRPTPLCSRARSASPRSRLSVRDPYAIYAKHVLRLDALDPLAAPPGAAERGTLLHDILGRFAIEHPKASPPDALEELLQRGADAFRPLEAAYPELYAEWWPRFQRLGAAFVGWDQARRAALGEVFAERSGQAPDPARERRAVHAASPRRPHRGARPTAPSRFSTYKTGQPPSAREVFAGFSPQLTLEAAMLMEGGFEGVPHRAGRARPPLRRTSPAGGSR